MLITFTARPSDSEFNVARGVHESIHDSHAAEGTHHPSHPAFGATSAVTVNPPRFSVSSQNMTITSGEPPNRDTTILTDGLRGTGFSIWIVYFGLTNEPHLHRVYTSMLVTTLYTQVANLLSCESSAFQLFVHAAHLWHSGRITILDAYRV